MTVFGKPLSRYVSFAQVFLILILLTGLVRLGLSLSGVPNSTARWFTMTGLMWIALIYYAVRTHTTGLGGYKELLVICALINLVAQSIAILGIAIAMITGTNNVFSSPEFAFGGDGKSWTHLLAHLLFGTTAGTLVPWAIGSLIMALTKKLSSKRTLRAASA